MRKEANVQFVIRQSEGGIWPISCPFESRGVGGVLLWWQSAKICEEVQLTLNSIDSVMIAGCWHKMLNNVWFRLREIHMQVLILATPIWP